LVDFGNFLESRTNSSYTFEEKSHREVVTFRDHVK